MSYLVPRDKPQECRKCPYINQYNDCRLIRGSERIRTVEEQYQHCLLIEIPPHGRLIDADKIDYHNDAMHDGTGHLVVADNFMNGVLWINDCIDNAPTVIEAED